jgi:hypothetical protein
VKSYSKKIEGSANRIHDGCTMSKVTILKAKLFGQGYPNQVQLSPDGRQATVMFCGQNRVGRMARMHRDRFIRPGALMMIHRHVNGNVILLGKVTAVEHLGVTNFRGAHHYRLTVACVQPVQEFPCDVPEALRGVGKPRHMWKALMRYTGMTLRAAAKADAIPGIFRVERRLMDRDAIEFLLR